MDVTRTLFLLVIVVLLAVSVAFVLPFLDFFLLAVVLAYVLLPIQKRLEERARPAVAAVSIVAVASVTIILPLVYVVRTSASDAVALLRGIRDGDITFAGVEAIIGETTGLDVDLSAILQQAVSNVEVDNLLNVFGAVTHLLIGLGLTLFLLYYFLRDRDSFLRWLRRQTPLSGDVQDRLFAELDHIMKAVLVGHVFVAFVQGLLAGFGLVATGVPNAMFWTVVMTVLSLLPVVGSFLVWGPASAYLFVSGQPVLALGLALWGTIVVGISDDYLRPIVIDRYAEINPSVIIIGVLGGIYVIGFMGIFFGPVVIGMLRATIEAFVEDFESEGTMRR